MKAADYAAIMLNPSGFLSPVIISAMDSTACFDVYQRHRHVELLEFIQDVCDHIHKGS